jgi:serine/threonine-protein kinase
MSGAITQGYLIAGKYRVLDKLGEGGMGAVWRAEHVTLRSHVAVKVLNQRLLAEEEGLRRFLQEAQAAAAIRSPHVVQILDHGVDADAPYIVMELMEGESLATRLASARTLSAAQTARIVSHVARALTKAHDAGIVHRDLKPDNVFLVKNDDEEIAKVLDFGIAKVTQPLAEDASKLSTQTGALLGTPYYMSPEQVRGHPLDHRSDLWSLAIIAYECTVGELPFVGGTVGDLLLAVCTSVAPVPSARVAVPPGFDAWFARGVERDPSARFQTAREMADALRRIVADPANGDVSFSISPPSAGRDPGASRDPLLSSAPTLLPSDQPQQGDLPDHGSLSNVGAKSAPLPSVAAPSARARAGVVGLGVALVVGALASAAALASRAGGQSAGARTAVSPAPQASSMTMPAVPAPAGSNARPMVSPAPNADSKAGATASSDAPGAGAASAGLPAQAEAVAPTQTAARPLAPPSTNARPRAPSPSVAMPAPKPPEKKDELSF